MDRLQGGTSECAQTSDETLVPGISTRVERDMLGWNSHPYPSM